MLYKTGWHVLRGLKMIHKGGALALSRIKGTNITCVYLMLNYTLLCVIVKMSLKYHDPQHYRFQAMVDFSEGRVYRFHYIMNLRQ